MSAVSQLPPLAEVISNLQLAAKKSLGQHFLTDARLLASIVESAGDLRGVHVLEIGPGPGGLTRALVASEAAQVVAIEKDRRFLAALAPIMQASPKLSILEQDALKVTLNSLVPAPRAVIANLPYNIGTELVVRMLQDIAVHGAAAWQSITVMLQREVAQRFCAQVGDDAYGRLSVLTGWLCEASIVRDVPAGAFSPPPKVTSSVLQLLPRATRVPVRLELLEKVVAAAFNQRRKMLRVSLKTLGIDGQALCDRAGIDATRRAETLSVEEFCALANGLAKAANAPDTEYR